MNTHFCMFRLMLMKAKVSHAHTDIHKSAAVRKTRTHSLLGTRTPHNLSKCAHTS